MDTPTDRQKPAAAVPAGPFALPALLLVALLVVPAWWFISLEVFPFTDLPNHLAAATIYRHLDDPATRFAEFYSSHVSLFKPNIAHILFCSVFPSVELGNRVWLLSMLVLLGGATVLFFRTTRAHPALMPLAVLLVCNANLLWGFMGFAFAVPLLLALTVALLHFFRGLSPAAGIAVALLLVVLFYAHVFALLFGFLVVSLAAFLDGRNSMVRRLVAAAVVMTPALVLFVGWFLSGEEFRGNPTVEYLLGYYRWHYAGSLFPRAGRLLTNDNIALAASPSMVPLTGIFSFLLLSGLILVLKNRERFRRAEGSGIVFAFLLAASACYAALPNAIPGVVPVYARFSVIIVCAAFLAAALSLPPGRTGVILGASVLAAGAYLAVWHLYFTDFRDSTRDFTQSFLASAGGGSTVAAAIIRDPEFRGSRPLVHFNNYLIIWNRAVTPTKMAEYRFGAIRAKRGGNPLPEYQEWVSPDADIPGLLDRYGSLPVLLYHGEPGGFEREAKEVGAGKGGVTGEEELQVIARSGRWTVYRRTTIR